MKHILVIRLSAMGDVAIAAPVIKAVQRQNKRVHIHLVTRAHFKPLFKDIPNLSIYTPDLQTKHLGFFGINGFCKEINRKVIKFDAVVDLHGVLRSFIMRLFFSLRGVPTFGINKERSKRKKLTCRNNKERTTLTPSFERYCKVFRAAGLKCDVAKKDVQPEMPARSLLLNQAADRIPIGLAPFAKHAQKVYPIEKMGKVIELLTQQNYHIYLFGFGDEEGQICADWVHEYPNVTSVVNSIKLEQEIDLMQQLKLMITMDSANMHIAAANNVPVISIWGATHTDAGFAPILQPLNQVVEISTEELPCRPCSVFGNKLCYRGDFACMERITPAMIVERVNLVVKN